VDVVSFCLYPGQEDVPSPFWNHPTDLSGKNYLPFLRRHYDEYRRLRWLLGKRFAGKAKAVYEFETFYNQTSYLYPAMARLFRSLGAQIAHMWTYSLTPTAEYLGGSHHLNLYCTPQKAVSFIIAEAVFAESPRYAPYDATGTDPVTFDHCAVSFARGGSILQTPDRLMYSRSFDWSPWPARPDVKEIIGCGGSSLVSYDGTGAYFVRVGKDSIDITIDPDATFTRPPWQRQAKKPWAKSCLLDSQTAHPFALHLPGWKEDFTVYRIEGGQATPVPNDGPTPNFRARAGQYRVERKAPSGKEIR
jgi:hypothetical protein